jgi:hypothetical protein
VNHELRHFVKSIFGRILKGKNFAAKSLKAKKYF